MGTNNKIKIVLIAYNPSYIIIEVHNNRTKGGMEVGVGYVIACLISILLWRIDRQKLIKVVNTKLRKEIRNKYVVQFIYFCILTLIYIGLALIKNNEVYNAITALIVIDISNTERKNLNHADRKHFYDTISTISRALVCGFIAPLFYIVILGNQAAIVFTLLYNLNVDEDFNILGVFLCLASIIPSLLAQGFLYVIYIFRNKKLNVQFKGDYASNIWKYPHLNVDILAAYIESVNFYFHYNNNNMHYLKSYGDYSGKIDDVCIKDYLSVSYSICFILFNIFIFSMML